MIQAQTYCTAGLTVFIYCYTVLIAVTNTLCGDLFLSKCIAVGLSLCLLYRFLSCYLLMIPINIHSPNSNYHELGSVRDYRIYCITNAHIELLHIAIITHCLWKSPFYGVCKMSLVILVKLQVYLDWAKYSTMAHQSTHFLRTHVPSGKICFLCLLIESWIEDTPRPCWICNMMFAGKSK